MFDIECLDLKAYNQLPGNLSPDYKYLHARQIPHQLSFPTQTIPDCARHTIGVFCYNFKPQTNILASYIVQNRSGVVMFTYSLSEC